MSCSVGEDNPLQKAVLSHQPPPPAFRELIPTEDGLEASLGGEICLLLVPSIFFLLCTYHTVPEMLHRLFHSFQLRGVACFSPATEASRVFNHLQFLTELGYKPRTPNSSPMFFLWRSYCGLQMALWDGRKCFEV